MAEGSGRFKFFYWTQTLDWDEPCPVLWGSADAHKPLCVKPSRFQRAVSIAEAFCRSRGVHIQGLVLLTIYHCGSAKPETLPEAAWADGETIHWLCSFQLLQVLAVSCFSTFPRGFPCTLSRCDILELFLWVPCVPLGLLCLLYTGLCLLYTNTC